MNNKDFQDIVWKHYDGNKRTMPWRNNTGPYYIFVSEVMLQQTQASRVIPKFEQFIASFPDFNSIAQAPFEHVLREWRGLGYNRRAKFLHCAAQEIVNEYGGRLPRDQKRLEDLPGIGPNTAGAILAYVYNMPVVYIETNIRTVYLHHFFKNKKDIHDKDILPLIQNALPQPCPKHARSSTITAFSSKSASEPYIECSAYAPKKKRSNRAGSSGSAVGSARKQVEAVCMFREWYWALMDYGTYLKKQHPNPSRASKHHTKQSKFEGSERQLRGKILALLTAGPQGKGQLEKEINDPRFEHILTKLASEDMLIMKNNEVKL